MEPTDLTVERFNIVLSLRYHNLRILLHRPILEKYLDAHGESNIINDSFGPQRNMVQQIGISSIQTCVESAIIIISAVHTVVLANGWRRDLLGAWNYSLFYSKLPSALSFLVGCTSLRHNTNVPSVQCWSGAMCRDPGITQEISRASKASNLPMGISQERTSIYRYGS